KLNDVLSKSITLLNDDGKLLELLFDFKEQLAEVSAIIPGKFDKTKEEVEGLYYILDDTKHILHDALSNNEYDEQELNDLQARLNDIQFLEQKYGKSLNDLIPFIEELQAEINKIENIEESTTQLHQAIAQLYDKVMTSGLQLSKARRRV
ncbi:hypothetical protein ONN90_23575, partial [Salmonella enterica subsp. enterica serovar Montevideo]|nr:hypothetical protein [Salmonella enterica subsp. enterica serovar Montevideo]